MRKVLRVINGKVGFFLAIVLAASVGGLTTSLVRAAIPDSDGVIHGCYTTGGGSLDIIDDSSQSCSGGQTALTWDQQPNVIGNALSIDYGGDSQTLISIPGFGNLIASCDSEGSANFTLHNTSAQTIYTDNGTVSTPTGEDSPTGASLGFLVSGNSSPARTANLQFGSSSSDNQCYFDAQATVSQP